MTMADCFSVKLGQDIEKLQLCVRNRVKFQTWGNKMFVKKFHQHFKSLMKIFPAVFKLLTFSINNGKG